MSDPTRVVSTHLPSGRPALALVAKRAYRRMGSSLCPERGACPLQLSPERAPSQNPDALDRLVHDSDLFSAAKLLCDVLVVGSAHAPRGHVQMLDTGVKVGEARKVVRVWGDRSILVDAGGRLRFSTPERFVSMPLSWDAAYGGRDTAAEERLFPSVRDAFGKKRRPDHGAVAYPRNPAGRGFFIDMDRERLDGRHAPNLEDPEDPVTPDRLLAKSPLDWLDRPVAAGYGPLDPLTFPRASFFVPPAFDPPTRPVREVRLGFLRAQDLADRDPFRPGLDPRGAHCASPGLTVALARRIRLGLWNLWPGRELMEVDLPPEVPELLIEPPGCSVASLTPSLRTVLVEPEEGRVTLTWAGALEVAASFPAEACHEIRSAVRWQK